MTTPPPTVSARVVEKIVAFRECFQRWPGERRFVDEQAAEAALLAAIADAIEEARREGANGIGLTKPVDPREPDPARPGFWALHNCAGCENGKWQCITDGGYRDCPGPRARND